MRKISTFAATALAVGSLNAAAWAGPVPFGTVAAASVDASAADDPQFADSHIAISNGVITDNVVNGLQGGPGNTSGSTSASGSSVFATATATEQGSFRFGGKNGSTVTASGDLATGTLHLLDTPSGSEFFGSPSGRARATIGDLVTFNNTTGGTVSLAVSLAIHGTFSTTAAVSPTSGHSVDAFLEFQTPSLLGQVGLGVRGVRLLDTRGDDYYVHLGYDGSQISGFSDNGSGAGLTTADLVNLTGTASASTLDETLQTDLLLPSGLSTVDIGAQLDLSCDSDFLCDLSHTATLGFGPLPTGLSFVPQSGVFLTPPAGGTDVPEPGSLALLAAGLLGLAGLRRRTGSGSGSVPLSA